MRVYFRVIMAIIAGWFDTRRSVLLLRIICLFFSLLISSTVMSAPGADCILLGSQPSFIIKLKNNPSNLLQSNSLSIAWLNHLSTVSQLKFTRSQAMAGGAYVVFFKPFAPRETCYSIEQMSTILNLIKQDGSVEYVDPNQILHLTQKKASLPTSHLGSNLESIQWDMNVPGLGGIDALNAWNITQANSNVIVGVLDTGVFANASLDPNLRPGVTFNNNGQWSLGATPSCGVNECNDSSAHGTHTAGTVAASGALAYGHTIFGVAPAAKVLPINIFTKFTSEDDCGVGAAPCLGAYDVDYINAIYWLTGTAFNGLTSAPNVVAINMSFGGNNEVCGAAATVAFKLLQDHNITAIAAAGNNNSDMANFSPANCSDVIAVAATGATKLKAYYSNWGNTVAIAAPGGDLGIDSGIYSTTAAAYAAYQGTSMAAPHIAGVAALLYAVDPTMTPARALQIMQNNVTAFATTADAMRTCAPAGRCGTGIINAATAVSAVTVPNIVWSPNFIITHLSTTSTKIGWSGASWSNQASTSIV
ncbi:MAG: hypothetical protein EXR81_00860, partial [Gammaproteobacteria bacterium]|nr:hypothetical protein [Gammaproteobacteria bacterium]